MKAHDQVIAFARIDNPLGSSAGTVNLPVCDLDYPQITPFAYLKYPEG